VVDESHDTPKRPLVRTIVSIVLCLLLLGGAAAAVAMIFATQPKADTEGATRKSAALVETITVTLDDHQPELIALGRVQPAQEVALRPRVAGEVLSITPQFVPGGFIADGKPLLKIDPADYDAVLAQRKAERDRIKARLEIERGMQKVAQAEYDALGEDLPEAQRKLVLREPQISELNAQVAAAESQVTLAQLQVDRTQVTAPFDAQILSRSVNVGSQVSPGDELAHLVGTGEYWVIATIPLRHEKWLRFGEDAATASPAQIRHTTAWEPGAKRSGYVTRRIGTVDQQTRLLRVLITVPDPLALETAGPSLVLDTILEARITGRTIPSAARLHRDHLRKDNTVWVMKDGKLDIRKVTVTFRDAQYAYITEGLEPGERVVTTTLATVRQGIDLLEKPKASTDTRETADE
jgi:RND family efflux transporter MFP subunit